MSGPAAWGSGPGGRNRSGPSVGPGRRPGRPESLKWQQTNCHEPRMSRRYLPDPRRLLSPVPATDGPSCNFVICFWYSKGYSTPPQPSSHKLDS